LLRRVILHALNEGVRAGAVEACRAATQRYDPLLRMLARKRVRRAVRAATSLTTVHEPAHLLCIAYLAEARILGTGRVYRPQLAKLFLAVTRHSPDELRAAAARLYQREYGHPPPQVTRKSVRVNSAWRH
jgi:hypothetical protein